MYNKVVIYFCQTEKKNSLIYVAHYATSAQSPTLCKVLYFMQLLEIVSVLQVECNLKIYLSFTIIMNFN